ncbi:cytochrome b/b6 domain-containing protein, partial [Klebsiella michiganensis]|uniref:cytochrome b/b6 domain-containing protein n=1 Tax=Klebsiella michiganensis TaxID=1134687 RepID=UPI001CE254E6
MKRRDTIVRYTAPERINHWVTAFCFVLAAVSGLGFFFPSFNWLMQIMGTPQLARILHPFVGVIMFASFIIMFFRYWHHNLINKEQSFKPQPTPPHSSPLQAPAHQHSIATHTQSSMPH